MPFDPAQISISNAPAGYIHGMRQPSVLMTLSLAEPDSFEATAAFADLQAIFNISDDELHDLRILDGVHLAPPTAALLRATCVLAKHLLTEGGIPVFEGEVVTSITPAKTAQDQTCITFRAPVVAQIPRTDFFAAYANALNMMLEYTKATKTRNDTKAMADQLFAALVQPMRIRLGRGLSTKPIFKEAYLRNIPFSYLANGVYQLGYGAQSRLMARSGTDGDSVIGANLSNQKQHTQTILNSVGAPTAATIMVPDRDAAVKAARQLGFPVVLKPANLDRSEGVFVDLMTDDSVRRAFDAARKLSSSIMVQQRIDGHCQRLVVFKGRFVFGFTRHPAGIEGDGVQTLRALVSVFNAAHQRRAKHLQSKPLPFDETAMACLADQGILPDDVLAKDQVAFLRNVNLMNFASHNEIITDKVHPENIKLIERLAPLFRLESCGFDLISNDPSRPWFENGAAITELNYHPQVGYNTARAGLAALFPENTDALIPVKCFVGGPAAMEAAEQHLATLHAAGNNAALASQDLALSSNGSRMHLHGTNGLFRHCLAILRDPTATTLLIVIQTDAWEEIGLPFTGLIEVTHVDSELRRHSKPNEVLPPKDVAKLIAILKGAALNYPS